ncbi:MAG: ABC transporter permease [Chloroflexi bacterium]|nr:ABC transporter permease [Chloroflexota bacterium]
MRFLYFFVRRFLHSIFVLLGLSVVIYVISRIVPGDPARMAVGYQAPQWVVNNMREYMHLNDTIPVQFFYWLRSALSGDLGISLLTRRPVIDDIRQVFPATLELALYAGLIMAIGGIMLGTLSAHHKDKWVDNVVRVFAYMGIVTPAFVFGIVFTLVFGFWLNWLPTIGRISPDLTSPPVVTGLMTVDSLLAGKPLIFIDAVKHLLMPSIALAMAGLSQGARITRATMSDNLGKDYIAAERALGIPERQVLWKFLLKPSLIPTVSILGLDIAAAIGNAFLLELIFSWPGVSRYGVRAMLAKDLNAISAVVLILGLAFVVVNICVDLVVGILDPRIRLSAQRNE